MYGVSVGADEWKKINYTGRSLGKQVYEVSRATIEEDGNNFYIANGTLSGTFCQVLDSLQKRKLFG